MNGRLPAKLEVDALVRAVQGEGGFASILHQGDPDSGTISLLVTQRGEPHAMLDRRMAADFTYRWREAASPAAEPGFNWRAWIENQSRIDPDCWLIELDVADAQRFIAETTASG